MSEALYPIFGARSAIHIIGIDKKTCLCGASTRLGWECSYGDQIYPEITRIIEDKSYKLPEFREQVIVGNDRVPAAYFCKKCFSALKKALEKITPETLQD